MIGDQFISASVVQQVVLAITADSILMCYSLLQQLVDCEFCMCCGLIEAFMHFADHVH